MILCEEVKPAKKLEGEDHVIKKDIVIATLFALTATESTAKEVAVMQPGPSFAYAYATAANTSTATAEYTIKEIAVVKRDEAPVVVQQVFAMGDEQNKFTGGGHASLQVTSHKESLYESRMKWRCLTAIRSSTSHTFQPPAYFPKPSKLSRKSTPVMSRNKPVGHLPTPKPVVDHTTETEGDYHYQETVTMSASSATHTFMQGCTRVEGITVERGKAEYYDIPGGGHASIQVFRPVSVQTSTNSPVGHLPAAGPKPVGHLPTPNPVEDHTTETKRGSHYQVIVTLPAYTTAAYTSTATMEYTIKEIALVKHDEAPEVVQQVFALGDEQNEFTGGGHASTQVSNPVGHLPATNSLVGHLPATVSPVGHLPAAGTIPVGHLPTTNNPTTEISDLLGTDTVRARVENMGYNPVGHLPATKPYGGHYTDSSDPATEDHEDNDVCDFRGPVPRVERQGDERVEHFLANPVGHLPAAGTNPVGHLPTTNTGSALVTRSSTRHSPVGHLPATVSPVGHLPTVGNNIVGRLPTIDDGDYKTDVKEVWIDDHANNETDNEKNTQAPGLAQHIHY